MRRHTIFPSAFLALMLCGCAVGPNYQPPENRTPDRYSEAATSQPTTRPASVSQWWTLLDDPMLTSLIERAVRSNLDLQLAEARVREARASYSVVAADWWPQLNSSGGYSYKGISENVIPDSKTGNSFSNALGRLPSISFTPGQPDGAGGVGPPTITLNPGGSNQAASAALRQVPREQNLFQAGFDAGWEIDVFGGTRRATEAASADIQVAEEDRNDVLISLVAEVARNYIDARGHQHRILIANENIASQKESVELTRSRFDAGLTTELDVSQAEAQLATTRSQIPVLQIQRKRSIHRLGVLLGQSPGSLLEELQAEKPIPSTPPDVPAGLPSELLRRRPDIRRNERQLAAATARIGVATADLFPRFSLTGTFGTQTHDMAYFLDNKSLFFSVGPSVSWPIFQGGRIVANIEVQNARQQQQLIVYGQTVLSALEEVENALVSYQQEQIRHRELADAVAANKRSLELANELYIKGLARFLDVLESQRSLYLTQDQLVQSENLAASDLIALYKALGGGWQVDATNSSNP